MSQFLAGYQTYIGVAMKILAALLAALTALSIEDYTAFVRSINELIGILALYFAGDAVASYGVRQAIQRKMGPDKAEDPKAPKHPAKA